VSSVTQNVMAPGTANITLKPDAPGHVIDALHPALGDASHTHVVVLPQRHNGFSSDSFARLDEAAREAGYTMVVTGATYGGRWSFSGYDTSWWMGTPDGLGGSMNVAVTGTTWTLEQWIDSILPNNGILKGTVTNPGGTWSKVAPAWTTRRELLDAICTQFDVVWRIRHDRLDVGPVADVFGGPTVLVTADPSAGISDSVEGFQGGIASSAWQVDGTNDRATGVGAGSGPSVLTSSQTWGWGTWASAKTLSGSTAVMRRMVSTPGASVVADINAAVNAAAGQFRNPRLDVSVQSWGHAPWNKVPAGFRCYVHDPDARVAAGLPTAGALSPGTPSVALNWGGQRIAPLEVSVHSMSWPITEGHGVIARIAPVSGDPYLIDITDFVEFGTGMAKWSCSTLPITPRSGDTPGWSPLPQPPGAVVGPGPGAERGDSPWNRPPGASTPIGAVRG